MSNTLHPYYLQQMGIETWHLRQAPIVHYPVIKLMIIGDAPDVNKHHDLFAGKAGGLLGKMLKTIGITANDVCFLSTSTANFSEALQQKMKINPPRMLLVMGSIDGFNHGRGNMRDYHGTPLMVSFHPRELLDHPADKKNAYRDLLCVQQMLAQIQR